MSKCHKILFAAALLAFVPGARAADMSGQWIAIAAETLQDAREAPEAAGQRLASVGLAIARALAGALPCGSNRGDWSRDPLARRERRDAAVAVAGFVVLESLYPERREHFEARLALALSHIPETPAKAQGAALGRRVASEVLAAR